jgi:hypothetical protein
MYIAAIAWIYVALMMAAAEATSTQGTLLGAFFTFLLYGVLPVSILVYIMGTKGRRQKRRAAEAAAAQADPSPPDSSQADDGGHAAADRRPPV